MSLICKFLSFLKYHKRNLAVALIFIVAESLVGILTPLIAGKFSSAMLEESYLWGMGYTQIALLWMSLFLAQAVFRFFSTYRTNLVGAEVLTEMSCRLYDHIQLLPVSYFKTTKKGETLSLLNNDVALVSHFLTGVLTSTVPITILGIGALYLMATINLTVTLLIAALVPLFFLVIKLLGKYLRPISENVLEKQSNSLTIASENISSITLVKAFTRETEESKKYRNNAQQLQIYRLKQLKIQAFLSPLVQLMFSVGLLTIVLICAIGYKQGELSIPDLITLLMYGLLFSRPVSALANLYGQTVQSIAAMKRINRVFDISPEPSSKGEDTPDNYSYDITSTYPIQITNVTFAHKSNALIFKNLDLFVGKNKKIIIKGPNGAGKSSLLHLIMRFVLPSEGYISIGGQPVEKLRLAELRKSIGYVPQNVAMSDGTIFDNICYGLPSATEEQVVEASKNAGAHQFIQSLPNEYQTPVGENGALLSGGQKQKIALARALLFNPKILLLDEPTSMLDESSKQHYLQVLSQTMAKYTVVMVTHNNDFDTLADEIYRIKENRLVIEKASKQEITNE